MPVLARWAQDGSREALGVGSFFVALSAVGQSQDGIFGEFFFHESIEVDQGHATAGDFFEGFLDLFAGEFSVDEFLEEGFYGLVIEVDPHPVGFGGQDFSFEDGRWVAGIGCDSDELEIGADFGDFGKASFFSHVEGEFFQEGVCDGQFPEFDIELFLGDRTACPGGGFGVCVPASATGAAACEGLEHWGDHEGQNCDQNGRSHPKSLVLTKIRKRTCHENFP